MRTPHILLPTTDLYFLNAYRDRVGFMPFMASPPATQVLPNVFAGRDTVLISRYITERQLDRLMRDGSRKLVYLIDDDIEAAPGDDKLPLDYRRKMGKFVTGPYQKVLERADTFVVSTRRLAKRYRDYGETVQLTPCWHRGAADVRHYRRFERGRIPFRVAFLGTRIHRGEMEFLVPIIRDLLDRHENMVMTLFWGPHTPKRLVRHPRVNVRRQLIWPVYKRMIGRWRFHLALYPTIDSPFNAARSINKLIEHSIVGATGVYSAGSLISEHMEHGVNGLVVDNNRRDWVDAISEALANPAGLRSVYEAGAAYADRLNDTRIQRAFWDTKFA